MLASTNWAVMSVSSPEKATFASRRCESCRPSIRDEATDSARSNWRASTSSGDRVRQIGIVGEALLRPPAFEGPEICLPAPRERDGNDQGQLAQLVGKFAVSSLPALPIVRWYLGHAPAVSSSLGESTTMLRTLPLAVPT